MQSINLDIVACVYVYVYIYIGLQIRLVIKCSKESHWLWYRFMELAILLCKC